MPAELHTADKLDNNEDEGGVEGEGRSCGGGSYGSEPTAAEVGGANTLSLVEVRVPTTVVGEHSEKSESYSTSSTTATAMKRSAVTYTEPRGSPRERRGYLIH